MPHLFSPKGSTVVLCFFAVAWSAPLAAQGASGLGAPPVADSESDAQASPAEMQEYDAPPATDAEAAARTVHAELLFGTTAPFDVSLGARLVLYERLLIGASIGRSVYGGLAGSIAGSFGGDEVAAVVQPIFSNAWVFRIGAGVRPLGLRGPELNIAYARWISSATWSAADLSLPASVGGVSADVGLNLLSIELAWSIDVYRSFFVRPAVGYTRVLGASVGLRSEAALSGQAQAALDGASGIAESTIEQYGHTPTLSLAVGARF